MTVTMTVCDEHGEHTHDITVEVPDDADYEIASHEVTEDR